MKGYTINRPVTNPDKTGRARAERLHPGEPCEVCGMPYGGRGRVQRHHRDSNRMNNDRSNIAFLCVQHHKDAHKATDGAVGGGSRPRITALLRSRAVANAAAAANMRSLGMPTPQIAAAFGVDRTTVDRWFRKYRDELAA